MRVEHYASQYNVFAEGQIVVLDGEQVIGQGSGYLPTLISKTLNINLASSATHFISQSFEFAAPTTTVPTSVFTQPTAGASES